MSNMLKAILIAAGVSLTITILGGFAIYKKLESDLPPIETINDYRPLLVTQVYDRNNKKIGEFFKERRILVPVNEIPKIVIQAFLAAEDDQFYKHKGINWLAIARAAWANLKAGQTVQGASTITQQLVKTLFLNPEKTFERKFKEILLAQKIENNLTKDEILYLYLNQIFFGQNSYGIAMASETYFRKPVKEITLPEAAILAGLPKAPSAYSPVRNPKRAKERQLYVLKRMTELGYISESMFKEAANAPVKVYLRESFNPQSHGFVEAIRLLLTKFYSEDELSTLGFQIRTTIDLEQQIAAQESVERNLRDLDKRQGFRGPIDHISDKTQWPEFFEKTRAELIENHTPERVILSSGEFQKLPDFDSNYKSSKGIPKYMSLNKIYKGLVTEVSDALGVAFVQVGELKGIIDIESTRWARPFEPETRMYPLARLSTALKAGDVIWVRLISQNFNPMRILKQKLHLKNVEVPDPTIYAQFALEQEPLVEGATLTLDHNKQEVISMVGGYNFKRSQFNRVLQAHRQTGSSYKTFIFAAALDRGYHPSSLLLDAPIVYENQGKKFEDEWKPTNHSRSYDGEVTFRNALIRSLNVPAVKIIEDIGVSYALDYSRRLGIFSKLNEDFTLALGSSSLTLFEMTKAFAVFARLGKSINPKVIAEVRDRNGNIILSDVTLDQWFGDSIENQKKQFEERRMAYLEKQKKLQEQTNAGLATEGETNVSEETDDQKDTKMPIEPAIFFNDPEQLISPQTAYLMTSILTGVIRDPNGTAARVSKEIAFDVAGKTGSTNDYVDGWFVGYSPLYTTGVWVGFDQERTLGPSEVGGRTALPIWTDLMKSLHAEFKDSKDQPKFQIPADIEFVNVDYETGEKAKPGSRRVILQAFRSEDLKKLDEAQIREENVESAKEDLDE